jgi:hypothetical protein
LAFAVTALLVVLNSDAFLTAVVLLLLLSASLASLPAVLFLVYGNRVPRPILGRSQRAWIYVSALCLALGGCYLALMVGGAIPVSAGAAMTLVSLVTVVRAARYTPGVLGGPVLRAGSSSVIGILVAVIVALALPKFACGCGDKAHQALLTSDLRSATVAEEAFFADHHRYAVRPELDSTLRFLPTVGDSMIITVLDTLGWRAVATDATGHACGVWIGARPPDGMHNAREGVPRCWVP